MFVGFAIASWKLLPLWCCEFSTRQLRAICMYCCHRRYHHASFSYPTSSRYCLHNTFPIIIINPVPATLHRIYSPAVLYPLNSTFFIPYLLPCFHPPCATSPLFLFSVLTYLSQAEKVAKASAKAAPSATARSYVTTSRVSPSPPFVVLHVVEV